ncbi:hypothetical protein AB3R30_07575 [Leptolyngbyaceae cyanobacterium UHCC 1019]
MLPCTLQTSISSSIPFSVDAEDLAEQAQSVLDELNRRREPDQPQYSLEQVQQALTGWLQESLEQLLEEAVYHCCTGPRHYAVNRDDFHTHLQRAILCPNSHHATSRVPST